MYGDYPVAGRTQNRGREEFSERRDISRRTVVGEIRALVVIVPENRPEGMQKEF
jgi:hypothetical protein